MVMGSLLFCIIQYGILEKGQKNMGDPMRRRGVAIIFSISFFLLFSVSLCFALSGDKQKEWKNQTMLRMSVPYEKNHPTGMAAEYFAGLVGEESNGELEISVTYNTEPGSEKEIVTQLQFGGIAIAAVNYFGLCEAFPEINRYVGTYGSPEEAQAGFHGQTEAIQEYLSKERIEILSFYRPDYRCIASNKEPVAPGNYAGMKIHATKASTLSMYLLKLGAEIENFERTDLLRAVDSGFVDGAEMPLLLYNRAGYDKVMPYVWIYEDFLVPDVLVVSTVSLGNLTDEQQKLLVQCAQKTEEYQLQVLTEAQKGQEELRNHGLN